MHWQNLGHGVDRSLLTARFVWEAWLWQLCKVARHFPKLLCMIQASDKLTHSTRPCPTFYSITEPDIKHQRLTLLWHANSRQDNMVVAVTALGATANPNKMKWQYLPDIWNSPVAHQRPHTVDKCLVLPSRPGNSIFSNYSPLVKWLTQLINCSVEVYGNGSFHN